MNRLVLGLVLLLAATLTAACGSVDRPSRARAPLPVIAPPEARSPEPLRSLTADDLGRAAPGSPERAILDWWRAVQLGDARGTRAFYGRLLRQQRSARALRRQLFLLRARFRGRPSILDVREGAAGRALAYLNVDYGDQQINRTLPLGRENGKWRLLDDAFVAEGVRVAGARR